VMIFLETPLQVILMVIRLDIGCKYILIMLALILINIGFGLRMPSLDKLSKCRILGEIKIHFLLIHIRYTMIIKRFGMNNLSVFSNGFK